MLWDFNFLPFLEEHHLFAIKYMYLCIYGLSFGLKVIHKKSAFLAHI